MRATSACPELIQPERLCRDRSAFVRTVLDVVVQADGKPSAATCAALRTLQSEQAELFSLLLERDLDLGEEWARGLAALEELDPDRADAVELWRNVLPVVAKTSPVRARLSALWEALREVPAPAWEAAGAVCPGLLLMAVDYGGDLTELIQAPGTGCLAAVVGVAITPSDKQWRGFTALAQATSERPLALERLWRLSVRPAMLADWFANTASPERAAFAGELVGRLMVAIERVVDRHGEEASGIVLDLALTRLVSTTEPASRQGLETAAARWITALNELTITGLDWFGHVDARSFQLLIQLKNAELRREAGALVRAWCNNDSRLSADPAATVLATLDSSANPSREPVIRIRELVREAWHYRRGSIALLDAVRDPMSDRQRGLLVALWAQDLPVDLRLKATARCAARARAARAASVASDWKQKVLLGIGAGPEASCLEDFVRIGRKPNGLDELAEELRGADVPTWVEYLPMYDVYELVRRMAMGYDVGASDWAFALWEMAPGLSEGVSAVAKRAQAVVTRAGKRAVESATLDTLKRGAQAQVVRSTGGLEQAARHSKMPSGWGGVRPASPPRASLRRPTRIDGQRTDGPAARPDGGLTVQQLDWREMVKGTVKTSKEFGRRAAVTAAWDVPPNVAAGVGLEQVTPLIAEHVLMGPGRKESRE